MTDRYHEVWKKYGSELEQIEAKRSQWYRHIVLVSSSLFGILISLRPATTCTKSASIVCFSLALTLLAFCILFLSIKLYSQIDTDSKALEKYIEEAKKAIENDVPIPNIFVSPQKIFKISEYVGYVCFVSAILLLSLYIWLLYV